MGRVRSQAPQNPPSSVGRLKQEGGEYFPCEYFFKKVSFTSSCFFLNLIYFFLWDRGDARKNSISLIQNSIWVNKNLFDLFSVHSMVSGGEKLCKTQIPAHKTRGRGLAHEHFMWSRKNRANSQPGSSTLNLILRSKVRNIIFQFSFERPKVFILKYTEHWPLLAWWRKALAIFFLDSDTAPFQSSCR